MLLRALERREAQELRARLLPLEANFPAIAAWISRVEALPGYERTVSAALEGDVEARHSMCARSGYARSVVRRGEKSVNFAARSRHRVSARHA